MGSSKTPPFRVQVDVGEDNVQRELRAVAYTASGASAADSVVTQPVQIMDEVSKAVPELLWLTGLEATNTNVNLRGSTFNMSAIANLIDNLDRVEAFQEPVLQDWAQRRGRGVRAEAYDFRLTFPYSFKKPQPVAGDTPGAPGAAPAAAPAADRR